MTRGKPFKKLRDALFTAELDQHDLAAEMGIHYATVNRLLGAKTEWEHSQMYRALEIINKHNPQANINAQRQLGEFFPRGGY